MSRFKQSIFDKSGNHQINVNSGVKVFDHQVSAIMDGNVIGSTQLSWHIRPWCETECNGFTREPGHLRNFDLQTFDRCPLPSHVRRYVESVTKEEGCWLYFFFHYGRRVKRWNWSRPTREVERVPDCWVVVSNDMTKMLKTFIVHPTRWDVGWAIAQACIPFIVQNAA